MSHILTGEDLESLSIFFNIGATFESGFFSHIFTNSITSLRAAFIITYWQRVSSYWTMSWLIVEAILVLLGN